MLLTVNISPTSLAYTWPDPQTAGIASAVEEITDWEEDSSGNLHVVGYSEDGEGHLEYIKYNKIASNGTWGSWITISGDYSDITDGSYPADAELIEIELTSDNDPVVMYAMHAPGSRELRMIASSESSGGSSWDLVGADDGAEVIIDADDSVMINSAAFVIDQDDDTPHIFLSGYGINGPSVSGYFHVEQATGTDVFDATFDNTDYDDTTDSAYIGEYMVENSSFEEGGGSFYGVGIVNDGDPTYDVWSFTDAFGGWNSNNNVQQIQDDAVNSRAATIDVHLASAGKQVAIWTIEANGSTNKVYYAVQQDATTDPQSSPWNTPVDLLANVSPPITNVDTTFGDWGMYFSDDVLSADPNGATGEFVINKIGATSTDLDYAYVEFTSSGASTTIETIDSQTIAPGDPVGAIWHDKGSGSPVVAASVSTNAHIWEATTGGGGAVPEFSTYVYTATLMLVFGMLYKKNPEAFAFVGVQK